MKQFIFIISIAFASSQSSLITKKYKDEIKQLSEQDIVKKAFDYIEELEPFTLKNNITITEIPAPPFNEEKRSNAFKAMLESVGADEVFIDGGGNVHALKKGSMDTNILIEGHIDTVFPMDTDVKVRFSGDTLFAPGIGDDSRGLSVVLTLLKVFQDLNIKTKANIYFSGIVGEEGLGDLSGVKYLFNSGSMSIDYYIAVDGGGLDRIVTTAVGSHRYKVTFKGPGGHSWGAFGLVNPHHALGRAIEYFTNDADPYSRTKGDKVSYSVGRIGGGTSINSIPFESWMEVDMRSENPKRLNKMDKIFQKAIKKALIDQNKLARTKDRMTVDIDMVGNRPAGKVDANNALVQRAMASIAYLGGNPTLGSGSTNSNIPFSKQVPAVTIGRGGEGKNAHALNEWWMNKNGDLAIKNAFLILLSTAELDI